MHLPLLLLLFCSQVVVCSLSVADQQQLLCASTQSAVIADCLALSQQFKLQLAELTATQQRLENALSSLQQQNDVRTKTTNGGSPQADESRESSAQKEFDVKKYVADYLNGRNDRTNTYNEGVQDTVVSWTREALKNLQQQLEREFSNRSPNSGLRVFFSLLPEFTRNIKAVLVPLATAEKVEIDQVDQFRNRYQNFVVEWPTEWKNNELESISIRTRSGEPVTFLNKIVIRRDMMKPPRYEMSFA